MSDEPLPIDLSPLDPTRDAARHEAVASAIAARAMAARRGHPAATRHDVLAELASLRRPALAAAAAIALAAVPVLSALRPSRVAAAAAAPAAPTTDVLGIPTRVTLLAQVGQPPSLSDLAAELRAADAGGSHDR